MKTTNIVLLVFIVLFVLLGIAFGTVELFSYRYNRAARSIGFPIFKSSDPESALLCSGYGEDNDNRAIFTHAWNNRCFRAVDDVSKCSEYTADQARQTIASTRPNAKVVDYADNDFVPFVIDDRGTIDPTGGGVCTFSAPIIEEPWYDQELLGDSLLEGSFRLYNQAEIQRNVGLRNMSDYTDLIEQIELGILRSLRAGLSFNAGNICTINFDPIDFDLGKQNAQQGTTPKEYKYQCEPTLPGLGSQNQLAYRLPAGVKVCGGCDLNPVLLENLDEDATACSDVVCPGEFGDTYITLNEPVNDLPEATSRGFFIPVSPDGTVGDAFAVPNIPRLFQADKGSQEFIRNIDELKEYSKSIGGLLFLRNNTTIDFE